MVNSGRGSERFRFFVVSPTKAGYSKNNEVLP
jgi:hypothetical protein